jgi:hypothetical protein
LRTAEHPPDYALAAGLTLMQISVVLMLHWTGERLRYFYAEWERMEYSRAARTAKVNLARHELAEQKFRLDELKKKIELHIQYVESRWVRHNRIEELEEMAVKAVCEGYAAGIAANRNLQDASSKVGRSGRYKSTRR